MPSTKKRKRKRRKVAVERPAIVAEDACRMAGLALAKLHGIDPSSRQAAAIARMAERTTNRNPCDLPDGRPLRFLREHWDAFYCVSFKLLAHQGMSDEGIQRVLEVQAAGGDWHCVGPHGEHRVPPGRS